MSIHLHTVAVKHETGVKTAWLRRLDGAAIFGFLLPFSIVLYLAMRGGGFDEIVRGEFGVFIWWVVLLGSAVGVLSTAGWSRAPWTLLALFAAFTVWTGVAIIWSDSAERTVLELARNASYGGVLLLGLSAGTRQSLKRTVAGVATALAAVALIALASRLHPAWFPDNDVADILPETVQRLNYPVGYWNGLATLIAIGLPLMLWIASAGEHLAARITAAAVIPAMALAGYLTLSRGGAIEAVVALGVLLALYPRRSILLPALLNATVGSLFLVWAASRRADLADGLSTATAHSQANQMIALTVAVCAAVGAAHWVIDRAARTDRLPRPHVSRGAGLAALGIVLVVLVAAGWAAGSVTDAWHEFKSPSPDSNETSERFASASGNGRYQWWSESVDIAEERPLEGIGPGTWEFRWARDGTLPGFIRDAHSLYFQTAAELGFPGLALVLALTGFVVVAATRRTSGADPADRAVLAAATAGCATFVTSALVDWSWQLPVLPATFLLIAAAVMTADRVRPPTPPRLHARLLLCVLAVIGLAATALPLPAQISIRASQRSFDAGDLDTALEHAKSAEDWQPYAGSPWLQEALVLERMGRLDEAYGAAGNATFYEPADWRNWYVLARISRETENPNADAYYEQARQLNPRSPLFETQ
jgi:O-antigen ligase